MNLVDKARKYPLAKGLLISYRELCLKPTFSYQIDCKVNKYIFRSSIAANEKRHGLYIKVEVLPSSFSCFFAILFFEMYAFFDANFILFAFNIY